MRSGCAGFSVFGVQFSENCSRPTAGSICTRPDVVKEWSDVESASASGSTGTFHSAARLKKMGNSENSGTRVTEQFDCWTRRRFWRVRRGGGQGGVPDEISKKGRSFISRASREFPTFRFQRIQASNASAGTPRIQRKCGVPSQLASCLSHPTNFKTPDTMVNLGL
mgnify:CR=1 FL=1